MNGRGSDRRKTVLHNYHSSDGPRNQDLRKNLLSLKAIGSHDKLGVYNKNQNQESLTNDSPQAPKEAPKEPESSFK